VLDHVKVNEGAHDHARSVDERILASSMRQTSLSDARVCFAQVPD
jgi:hypothetical protein